MSTLYKITWEIDLEADTPRKAAETALEWLRGPGAECVMFTVQQHPSPEGEHYEPELIDLLEEEEEEIYTYENQHKIHPFEDWRYEVQQGYTQVGYHDWVKYQMYMEAPDE